MAMYSTFFLCKPDALVEVLPGWRLPLPTPVVRQFKNPLTGETRSIETREPEWPEAPEEGKDLLGGVFSALAIEGNYTDYLEGRLSASVQAWPHSATTNLTQVELGPLAETLGEPAEFESPLYAAPSYGAVLHEVPESMLLKLKSLDQPGLEAIAERWASKISTREHTHSITGVKLNVGVATSEALQILEPILALARLAAAGQRMYLLIEA